MILSGQPNLEKYTTTAHLKPFYTKLDSILEKFCMKGFREAWSLKMHIESIHDGVKYPCDQCNMKFSGRSYLKKHQRSVHEGIRYACNQCEYEAKWQGNLKKHKRVMHGG